MVTGMVYLLIAVCAAAAVLAVLPQPAPVLPKLPAREGLPHSQRGRWAGVLAAIGRPFARSGSPAGESVNNRLLYANSTLTMQQLYGIKVVAMVGVAFTAIVISREFGPVNVMWAVVGGVIGFIGPDVWLSARITRRHQAILRLLPEVIDLLTLCVGAGLDFLGALNKVVTLKGVRKRQEPLIDELSLVLQEIRLGKRRFEALKAMARRVNLPELSSFVRTLVLADRMGTPIAEVLSIHSDDVRFERYNRAERMALKAPIKILFPLIFCIMPCVALVVGAPILLQFLRENPFAK